MAADTLALSWGPSTGAEIDDFARYLLAEYENIAQAHFKTNEAISSFFRYYLTILAVPVSLIGLLIGLASREGLLFVVSSLRFPAILLSVVIAVTGVLVLAYLVNLRMDAVLYARVVNAIRKSFYDKNSALSLAAKLQFRVLPQSPSLPRYLEVGYFLPVVLAFAVFDGAYLSLAFAIGFAEISSTGIMFSVPASYWGVTAFFVAYHIILYLGYSTWREHSYLRSLAIGVDIDGVLNDHRTQFCKVLLVDVHKMFLPDDITVVPVHEDPRAWITRDEANIVFDDPKYWAEMPPASGAADTIRRLRNSFKLKVFLFTHRPWPEKSVSPGVLHQWETVALDLLGKWPPKVPRAVLARSGNLARLYGRCLALAIRLKFPGREPRLMKAITLCWLEANGFEFDGLIIERGSDDLADPRSNVRNRFYISRKKNLRFFVDDMPEKAGKLAYVCDIVFMPDHPYNRGKTLPDNVVPVDSWETIYRKMRQFL